MRRFRFEWILALLLITVYGGFYLWQTPGLLRGPLTEQETESYLARLQASPFVPPAARDELLRDLRAWARQDDGQPVYMLNLLRYYPQLQPYPGAPAMRGTPQQANAYYEEHVMGLALKAGNIPIYAGMAQGANLIGHEAAADQWSRVIVMRYPSRRHALALFANPDYLPYAPYKLAALKINLVPTTAELVLSDLRVLAGALLLVLFLLVCWLRALRLARAAPARSPA